MNNIDNLDTEFYIERAYELRRNYIAAAIKSLVARIKAVTSGNRTTSAPLQGNPAH